MARGRVRVSARTEVETSGGLGGSGPPLKNEPTVPGGVRGGPHAFLKPSGDFEMHFALLRHKYTYQGGSRGGGEGQPTIC